MYRRKIYLRDTYYDTDACALTTRDLWLRSRNGRLELKFPPHSNLLSPQKQEHQLLQHISVNTEDQFGVDVYEESTDLNVIARVLRERAGVHVDFAATEAAAAAAATIGRRGSSAPESGKMTSSALLALRCADLTPFGTIVSNRHRHVLRIPVSAALRSSIRAGLVVGEPELLPEHHLVFVDVDFVQYTLPRGSCQQEEQVEQEEQMGGMLAAVHAKSDSGELDTAVFRSQGGDANNALYIIGEIELANDGPFNGLLQQHCSVGDVGRVRSVAHLQQLRAALMREAFVAIGVTDFSPVRGKILEYLYRHRPLHYRALEECGQLASKGII